MRVRHAAREVNIPTPRAEQFHGGVSRHVALSDRQHRLAGAVHPRTASEIDIVELFQHIVQAAVGEDVARVDEAVEALGAQLHQFVLSFVHLGVGHVHVQDHVKRVLVVGDLRGEAGEVEVVLDEVFVDLAEKLVAVQGAEPRYPRQVVGGVAV
eukprot:ctg_411.g201